MVLTSGAQPQPKPPHSGPKVSVFIPSYNKREWVLDALRSVFSQTMADWELWLLENSNDGGITRGIIDCELASQPEEIRSKIHYEKLDGEEIERKRQETYITAWLLNVYYPEANGEYIFYLSDDDLIDPGCLEIMAGTLDANPDYRVVYASLRHGTPAGPGDCGPWPDAGIAAQDPKMFPGSVDSRIDGGQIMHHKSCLDALAYPYFEEVSSPATARHADGIFMERLVGRFPFWPVEQYLITHRWLGISTWSKP